MAITFLTKKPEPPDDWVLFVDMLGFKVLVEKHEANWNHCGFGGACRLLG